MEELLDPGIVAVEVDDLALEVLSVVLEFPLHVLRCV